MKKVIIAVLIVLFMAGTTGATDIRPMRNQPLGWCGWAWGTPLEEVQGWLEFAGYLNIPYVWQGINEVGEAVAYELAVFSRQGQETTCIGLEWGGIYYVFEEEKLVGVILCTDSEYKALEAINYFGWNLLKEGGAAVDFSSFKDGVITSTVKEPLSKIYYSSRATGEYASFLFFGTGSNPPSSWNIDSYLIIGEPSWIDYLAFFSFVDY